MKQKDFMLITVVSIISAVFAIFLSNILITSPKNRQTKVEVVQPISPDFQQPNKKYINNNSVDPTQPVKIGSSNNNSPFNGN